MSPIRSGPILGLILTSIVALPLRVQAGDRVEETVIYTRGDSASAVRDSPLRDLSYDLYRAAGAEHATGALVIFVHSRFWRERHQNDRIVRSFVPALLEEGHSVIVLRHRLVPEGAHPTALQDVARGVAAILDRASKGEFDSERIFLAGHSSGAQLALLVALDPSWLAAEGASPEGLAGVLSISGILDLGEGGGRSAEEVSSYAAAFPDLEGRHAAALSRHVNPKLPSILLLTAANDVPGYRDAARKLAKRLRERGQPAVEGLIAKGRDHFSILDLSDPRNDARRHIFEYLASHPRNGALPESWQVLSTWREPPYSTEPIARLRPAALRRYRADMKFNRVASRLFMVDPARRPRLVVGNYAAVDLLTLLEALGPERVGRGEWLEMTNIRGERSQLSMKTVRALRPRVVVAIDGEENLFRLTDLYHTRRRYSWVDPEPSTVNMARPLGAFLFFPNAEPGPEQGSAIFGRYGLTLESFRLREEDSFARLADLPESARSLLRETHACLACHRLRGVGGRAGHIRATDAVLMGGHALPLERYPRVVWKRFIFDQAAVAEEVGADAVVFDPEEAQLLFDLVERERSARQIESWIYPDRQRD